MVCFLGKACAPRGSNRNETLPKSSCISGPPPPLLWSWWVGEHCGRDAGEKERNRENMNNTKFLTYNVCGLNSPEKRHVVLRELERNATEIIFLQETHVTQDSNVKLYSRNIPIWYYGDSPIRKAKGVAIGFGKNVRFVVEKRKVDPEGCFLFLVGTLQGMKYTLSNVYCPNKNPKKYLVGILKDFMEFKQGKLILVGDFNFSMDHKLHSTSVAQDREIKQLRMIKKIFEH